MAVGYPRVDVDVLRDHDELLSRRIQRNQHLIPISAESLFAHHVCTRRGGQMKLANCSVTTKTRTRYGQQLCPYETQTRTPLASDRPSIDTSCS